MKRLWFGAALLFVLLAASLCMGQVLEDLILPAEQDLNKASVAALEGNWPLAAALYLRAGQDWARCRNLAATLARHDPIEAIDLGFAALPAYAACQDAASFCAACDQLAQQLHALPQPHSVKWWNLL